MGVASSLDPDAGYDPDVGESAIPSTVADEGAPAGDRSYDEMSDAECERLAAQQGWKPLSVYNGRPGGWSNARDFLKRAETEMPILRAQNRRMNEKLVSVESEVLSLRSTVGEQRQILDELRTYARTANEDGYRRARAELEVAQDEAAANADQAGVRQARERIKALDDSRPQSREQPPARQERTQPAPQSEEVARAYAALKQREPWIGRDSVLTQALIEADSANVQSHPDMPVAQRFDLSVANVKRDFPQFFPSARSAAVEEEDLPAREPAPPARPQSRAATPPARRGPPSADSIASIEDVDDRAQAKLAFERYKRQFPDSTEAEYMAIYRNPKIDVRALKEARKRG